MGWPIHHSLSPKLHGHWFERYGCAGTYIPLPVRPEDVELAFNALPKLGFAGWNVTLPHKEAAFRLVDRHDPAATHMGAVNTVLVEADGRLLGLNTDGAGFLASLRAQAPGWQPAAGTAVLLGTGGAARGVAVALLEAGVPALRLVNRTASKADRLAQELARLFPMAGIGVLDWAARGPALAGAALLVQCTSLGMAGKPELELALDALPPHAIVTDLVYVPIQTDLLRQAQASGYQTVDGLGMLLHQAVPGFAHWGGVTPEVDEATRSVLLAAMAARS